MTTHLHSLYKHRTDLSFQPDKQENNTPQVPNKQTQNQLFIAYTITMVDVDRRMSSLNTPSHTAALRRLSARASAPPSTATTPHPVRSSLLSFTTLTIKVITHLRNSNIKIQPGLTETEFARIEASFNFTFPPDLKALLSAGLPTGPGFPDWRSRTTAHLKRSFDLPTAAISCQIVNNTFWAKSWGAKPNDPETAIAVARNYLRRKTPILIPIYDHCYIPANPCLAGNPIFFIDETRVYCCGFDLSDFYDRFQIDSELTPILSFSVSEKTSNRSSSSSSSSSSAGSSNFSRKSNESGGKTPRWVEFWSDAGARDSRRCKNSIISSPERSIEMPKCEIPKWVDEYIDEIGSVLRKGGWKENDVDEIKQVSAAGIFDGNEMILLDNQAFHDALLLKADRFSNSLRKSGWSSEEVSDVLGFDFSPEKERRFVKKLAPELVEKIGKLADSVLR